MLFDFLISKYLLICQQCIDKLYEFFLRKPCTVPVLTIEAATWALHSTPLKSLDHVIFCWHIRTENTKIDIAHPYRGYEKHHLWVRLLSLGPSGPLLAWVCSNLGVRAHDDHLLIVTVTYPKPLVLTGKGRHHSSASQSVVTSAMWHT